MSRQHLLTNSLPTQQQRQLARRMPRSGCIGSPQRLVSFKERSSCAARMERMPMMSMYRRSSADRPSMWRALRAPTGQRHCWVMTDISLMVSLSWTFPGFPRLTSQFQSGGGGSGQRVTTSLCKRELLQSPIVTVLVVLIIRNVGLHLENRPRWHRREQEHLSSINLHGSLCLMTAPRP